MEHDAKFYSEARSAVQQIQSALLALHDAHNGTGERAVALGLMDAMDDLSGVIGNLEAYEELASGK